MRSIICACLVLVTLLRGSWVGAAPGDITTYLGSGVAGSGGGGPSIPLNLNFPRGLGIDEQSDILVADERNHQIRHHNVSIDWGSTVCGIGTPGFSGDGGPAVAAQLDSPQGVSINPHDNDMIIADTLNHRIRAAELVNATPFNIYTIAGIGVPGYSGDGGPAALAALDHPADVVVDSDRVAYVADRANNVVRFVNVF